MPELTAYETKRWDEGGGEREREKEVGENKLNKFNLHEQK